MEACRLKQVVQRWDPEHGFAWPLRLCYCLVWNPVHDPAQARTEAGGPLRREEQSHCGGEVVAHTFRSQGTTF